MDEQENESSAYSRESVKKWNKRFTYNPKWLRNYCSLSDLDRNDMLVDEIFALYLFTMSHHVNETFYKITVAYIIFFRECFNDIGWTKRIESEAIDLNKELGLAELISKYPFCLVNTAEHAPLICNEFVTVYVDQNKHLFEITKAQKLDLTVNFCHWLYLNHFTSLQLDEVL